MKAYKIYIILFCALILSCSHKQLIKDKELVDLVITKDTTLSGEIIVKGPLIVKKSANLTILPGTVIRFKRVYIDDDDISDSELNVEGSIYAVGTKEKKITFTSYENDPKTSDWKYLMVNFARESVIKNCIIEYAYSGVQIHFTKADVTDSVFRKNFDGVRFSTARIDVKNNEIYDNVNGIRYEERKAPANITKNNIYNNKIGIFCVIRSDDISTIEYNNIFDNDDYNVKLGIKQDKDITMINNYWGSAKEDEIKDKIFDKDFDEQLGSVKFAPFLQDKVEILK